MIGDLICRLFHARTAAHIFHLKTRSYAMHKALNEFYDEIVDLADTIAESWQGTHGMIEDYPCKFTMPKGPVDMLKELRTWIQDNRYQIANRSETALHNEIDNVITLIDGTLYKMEYLR